MRSHLLSLCILLVAVDCSLNPQPLPPEAPSDGGGVTIATPGVGNDSGSSLRYDAGKQGGGGGEPDAGTTGAVPDGSAEPPWADGGEATPDAAHNAGDAALDGRLDAGLPDGSASDGPHGDAASPADAPAPDAAGDGAL